MSEMARKYDVRAYGAQGNKVNKDTAAIQRAIDACGTGGGGVVYFGPGDYLSGRLQLRSRVTLYLEAGATVWSSSSPGDYGNTGPGRPGALLEAQDVECISLLGPGTVFGLGEADMDRRPGDMEELPDPHHPSASVWRHPFRVGMINFERCQDVTIRDITLKCSDFWTVLLQRCERVHIDGVSILNNYYHINSDGINPVSCRDVRISNCHIIAGDDCICPKSESGYPCEHIVVTNCTLETVATAIKLGTASYSAFRDIHFSNCTIRNSCVGIGIFIKDGGLVERVTFSDMSISTYENPLEVAEYLQDKIYPVFVDIEQRLPESSLIGGVRDLAFHNLQIHSDNGILIQGMKESPIANLSLRNVTMRVTKGYSYAGRRKHHGGLSNKADDRITRYAQQPAYITVAHVDGLVVDDVRVLVDEGVQREYDRRALSVHEGVHGSVQGLVKLPMVAGHEPVVVLENCRETMVSGCQAYRGTGTFLGVEGHKAGGIVLVGNDLRATAEAVRCGAEVAANAVTSLSPV